MIPRTLIIGIDPGLDGAIAAYDPSAEIPLLTWRMPTCAAGKSGQAARKRRVDGVALARILLRLDTPLAVYVEDVHASPQMGPSSAFSFGRSAGVVHGIVAAMGAALILVAPQAWKRATATPADKRAARARASALFPGSAQEWHLAKNDGIAEAAIIAYYGYLDSVH